MRWLIAVNDACRLDIALTTAELAFRAAARGHEVWVCSIDRLELNASARLIAHARCANGSPTSAAMIEALGKTPATPIDIESCELLLIRTNPARDKSRDWAHRMLIAVARMARQRGVTVLSDPDGLERASNKLYLMELNESLRPRTLVTRELASVQRFLKEEGACVLKPLQGTHGTDVFLVRDGEASNLAPILDVLTRSGFAMVQSFVPEAKEGDVRVLILEGQPLTVGGRTAAVRRIPSDTDFRSNIHAGGRAVPAEWTPVMQDIVERVGERLSLDGLFLVGLDIIGEKVIEVNVFSPGGLIDAENFYHQDFISVILDAMERRAT